MKNSKKLIIAMIFISVIALAVSSIYYNAQNNKEDPRVLHIGEMYKNYNQYVRDNDQNMALAVLDSIQIEYQKIEHYQDSYEVGVVLVNKSAVYLTQALALENDDNQKEILLNTSEELLQEALVVYQKWNGEYSELSNAELAEKVSYDFNNIEKNQTKVINRRIEMINLALQEMDRRYSVIYSNLGIIKRHKFKQNEAIEYYKIAIEYWDENLTAKSNLNVLMGEEPIKRNLIQKLFPPERGSSKDLKKVKR